MPEGDGNTTQNRVIMKHERLRKDMDDGTQAQLPDSHPDAGRNTQPVADASSAAD